MTPFDLAEPKSLVEAIKLLDPDDAAVRPFAGGTALMLMMKAGVFRPTRLVSLAKIERVLESLGSMTRSTAPVRASTLSEWLQLLPPSVVLNTPRSGFSPHRWPSAAM